MIPDLWSRFHRSSSLFNIALPASAYYHCAVERAKPAAGVRHIIIPLLSIVVAAILVGAVVIAIRGVGTGEEPENTASSQEPMRMHATDDGDLSVDSDEGGARIDTDLEGVTNGNEADPEQEPLTISLVDEENRPVWLVHIVRTIATDQNVHPPRSAFIDHPLLKAYPADVESTSAIDPVVRRTIDALTTDVDGDVDDGVPLDEAYRSILVATLDDFREQLGVMRLAYVVAEERTDEEPTSILVSNVDGEWWRGWIYTEGDYLVDLEFLSVDQER